MYNHIRCIYTVLANPTFVGLVQDAHFVRAPRLCWFVTGFERQTANAARMKGQQKMLQGWKVNSKCYEDERWTANAARMKGEQQMLRGWKVNSKCWKGKQQMLQGWKMDSKCCKDKRWTANAARMKVEQQMLESWTANAGKVNSKCWEGEQQLLQTCALLKLELINYALTRAGTAC